MICLSPNQALLHPDYGSILARAQRKKRIYSRRGAVHAAKNAVFNEKINGFYLCGLCASARE
jgi:hypothetical protein